MRRSPRSVSHDGLRAASHALAPVAPVAAVAAVAQHAAHIASSMPACPAMPADGTMRAPGRLRGRAACGLVLAALAAGGCGDGGRTFSAGEFVSEIGKQGVGIRLGETLVTDEEGKELYAVELEPVGPRLPDDEGEPGVTGGSLSVYEEDGAGADGDFESCRAAADLLCYRAANVVVVLEGGGLEAQQLGVAMRRLDD